MNKQKTPIVDDSEINRALLIEIPESQYDIVEAENGVEMAALPSHYKTKFSLLLLDIMIPKMDGFEILAFTEEKKLEYQSCGYYNLCGQFSCEYKTGIWLRGIWSYELATWPCGCPASDNEHNAVICTAALPRRDNRTATSKSRKK